MKRLREWIQDWPVAVRVSELLPAMRKRFDLVRLQFSPPSSLGLEKVIWIETGYTVNWLIPTEWTAYAPYARYTRHDLASVIFLTVAAYVLSLFVVLGLFLVLGQMVLGLAAGMLFSVLPASAAWYWIAPRSDESLWVFWRLPREFFTALRESLESEEIEDNRLALETRSAIVAEGKNDSQVLPSLPNGEVVDGSTDMVRTFFNQIDAFEEGSPDANHEKYVFWPVTPEEILRNTDETKGYRADLIGAEREQLDFRKAMTAPNKRYKTLQTISVITLVLVMLFGAIIVWSITSEDDPGTLTPAQRYAQEIEGEAQP